MYSISFLSPLSLDLQMSRLSFYICSYAFLSCLTHLFCFMPEVTAAETHSQKYQEYFQQVLAGIDESLGQIGKRMSNVWLQTAHMKPKVLPIKLLCYFYLTASVALQVLLHIMHGNIYTATLLVYQHGGSISRNLLVLCCA